MMLISTSRRGLTQGLTDWPLLAAAVLVVAGCGLAGQPDAHPTPSASASPPCAGTPASSARLGFPRTGGPPARFETDGGPLFIAAHHFAHGDMLDFGPGSTAVYIGPEATPPTYDPQRDTVTQVTTQLRVKEGEWVALQLPAGRYWLLNSSGGDLEIVSCTPGGVTGQAVPPPYAGPSTRTQSPPATGTPSTAGSR